MKVHCTWTEKLRFVSTIGNHAVVMDAKKPLGDEAAPTPKEFLLSALCGCTGMDVISLLRKHQQPVEEFHVTAEAGTRTGHPAIFSEISIKFQIRGPVDPARVIEAVALSQTQYCSVSAMLSRAVPIHYTVEIDGEEIHRGQAAYDFQVAETSLGIT